MGKRRHTILIVDAEEMVTTSIATLLMIETDYEVLAINSPSEALKEIRYQDIDLAICNFVMPGMMDGVEFLQRLKVIYPDAICMLLVEPFINRTSIDGLYICVEMPWDNILFQTLFRKMRK